MEKLQQQMAVTQFSILHNNLAPSSIIYLFLVHVLSSDPIVFSLMLNTMVSIMINQRNKRFASIFPCYLASTITIFVLLSADNAEGKIVAFCDNGGYFRTQNSRYNHKVIVGHKQNKVLFPTTSSSPFNVSRMDENVDDTFLENNYIMKKGVPRETPIELERVRVAQHELPPPPSPLAFFTQAIFSIISLMVGGYWLLLLLAIITTFSSYGIDGIFLRVH